MFELGNEVIIKDGSYTGVVGDIISVYKNFYEVRITGVESYESKKELDIRLKNEKRSNSFEELMRDKTIIIPDSHMEKINPNIDNDEYTHSWELCPECDSETLIEAKKEIQTCTMCGEEIYPCSLCTDNDDCIKCHIN